MTRTYRGRTPDEQRAYNKQRREELKLAKEQSGENFDISTALDGKYQPDIKIEPIAIKKQSLKDRIFAKFKSDDDEPHMQVKSSKEHVQRSDDLFSHILPITIASLLAIYTEKLFVDPYKPVSPTREEFSTILLPMFAIFTRYIQISGKASQTAIDVGAILLAILTISTRMLMTVEEINRSEKQSRKDEKSETGEPRTYTSHYNQAQATGIIRRIIANDDKGSYVTNDEDASASNLAYGDYSDSEDGWSEAAQVANLLRRDTNGRRAMGYAPRFIQSENGRDI